MTLRNISLQEIIDMAMEKVPTEFDRRTGSVIYDTIASVAVPILYLALEGAQIEDISFIETTYGEYVDKLVADKAITRYPATKAVKKGRLLTDKGPAINIPIGTRFSAVDSTDGLVYAVLGPMEIPGEYLLECEIAGTVGNAYYGTIVPISYIDPLSSAEIIGDYQEARDVETDEELKQRYLDTYKRNSFGGNVSQYDEEVKKLDGVGDLQVHRAYPSSGHVLLSVVSPGYRRITTDLIKTLQDTIDPEVNGEQGTGLGIAPIFHTVHVTTPTERVVPISFKLQVLNGYTVEQLEPLIKEKLEELFAELRKNWGVLDMTKHVYEVVIYVARIIVAVSSIIGVANVSEVEIDGVAGDVSLVQTGERQELPILGEVTIHG
jgi:Uncharacterized homolog of phage Mu protein gp47